MFGSGRSPRFSGRLRRYQRWVLVPEPPFTSSTPYDRLAVPSARYNTPPSLWSWGGFVVLDSRGAISVHAPSPPATNSGEDRGKDQIVPRLSSVRLRRKHRTPSGNRTRWRFGTNDCHARLPRAPQVEAATEGSIPPAEVANRTDGPILWLTADRPTTRHRLHPGDSASLRWGPTR